MLGRAFVRKVLRVVVRLLLVLVALVACALGAFRFQAARRERLDARAAAPAGGRFVNAGDLEMFVQEAGPASAPAVLFVGGAGGWSETWRATLTSTAAAGFRAVAVDLPPFGFSERPNTARYGRADQARRLLAALDALGLDQAVVVGHSLGAGPCVEAALLSPARVRALVLVDAALDIRPDRAAQAPAPLWAPALLAVAPLRNAVLATAVTNPLATRRWLGTLVTDPAGLTDETVDTYRRPLAVRGSTAAVGDWLSSVLTPQEASASEDPAAYATLRPRVIVIWGDLDRTTPSAQGLRIVGLTPGTELGVITGVGHLPHVEAPDRFNDLFLRLIARYKDR